MCFLAYLLIKGNWFCRNIIFSFPTFRIGSTVFPSTTFSNEPNCLSLLSTGSGHFPWDKAFGPGTLNQLATRPSILTFTRSIELLDFLFTNHFEINFGGSGVILYMLRSIFFRVTNIKILVCLPVKYIWQFKKFSFNN